MAKIRKSAETHSRNEFRKKAKAWIDLHGGTVFLFILLFFLMLTKGNSQHALAAIKASSKDKTMRKAYVACRTCPIIWYDSPQQLAAIKAKVAEKNKDVRDYERDVFDPYSWSWEEKLNIYINMKMLSTSEIREQWQIHRKMYASDPTCPKSFTLKIE